MKSTKKYSTPEYLTELFKVYKFWEGHTILQNLHRRFDGYYIGQIYSGDFAKRGTGFSDMDAGHLTLF